MKTLDEVISGFECCYINADCEGCPYENISYPTEIGNTCKDIMHYDALHYLKAIETTENLYHDAVNELSKWKDEDWKDRCLPLTWDELRTMAGKPVWATFNNKNGMWYIAKVYDDEVVLCEWEQELGVRISGAWEYTPKRWQAYRNGNVEPI